MSKPTAKMSPLSPQAAWDAAVAETAARPELRHRLIRPTHNLRQRFGEAYARLTALPRAQRRRLQRRLSLGLAGIALLMVLGLAPMPALADTITVNGDGTGGTCSLADAIITANSGTNVGNCTGGTGGADTINLTTDVTLNAALNMITSDITIEGNGHFISGADTYNGPKVSSTGTFTLKNATITHCRDMSGGGLANNGGMMTIINSSITYNTADEPTYGGYGGGIYNSGTLIILNSTISNNISNFNDAGASGGYGGGLFQSGIGTVTITNSTFNNNFADAVGGGIALMASSTINMLNSTISGNDSFYGGGIYQNIGDFTIQGSTITNNYSDYGAGSGIYVSFGNMTVRSSIVANQANGTDCYGDLTSAGFNIESGVSCGFDIPTIDQQNVSSIALNLQALATNPTKTGTQTHALALPSVAIDKIANGIPGCNAGVTTDQRNAVRAGEVSVGDHRGGTACDIGAYEYDSNFTPTAVTLRSVTAVPNASPGLVGMLSAALSAALGGLMVWRRHRTKG